MRKSEYYQYYVEGDDDKKIVDTLKSDMRLIISGKCDKFNVVEKKLTKNHIMSLKNGTTVVLVFDVDTDNIDIVQQNIKFLNAQSVVKRVICITQVMNLEDELVNSCSIDQIKELTNSKSNTDFKRDVLKISNLKKRLEACDFSFNKFWDKQAKNKYSVIRNEAACIKLRK